MEFHRLLVQSGRNSVLDELYRQLTGRVQMLMAIADIGGRLATGNKDHKEILEAVQSLDLEEAKSALRKHLLVTRDAILTRWQAAEPTANGKVHRDVAEF